MSELGRTPDTAPDILPDPGDRDNVQFNPTAAELRTLAQESEATTTFGAPAYVSAQRSRSADRTRNAIDATFGPSDHGVIDDAVSYASEHDMICLDRRLGRHPEMTFTCRYYVPPAYARIALTVERLLEPAQPDAVPDFLTIQLPDWDDIAIRVQPEAGVTAILGSDYSGEAKKSYLRLFMYEAKRRGGIGLHAGSKRIRLEDTDGTMRDIGQLFLGLSATGKSTLTAHGLWLKEPEEATMVQDDVCALLPDGTVAGSEGAGLYVKTHGLNRSEQPAIYDAVTHDTAVLENVDVAADGTVDFDGETYTANGRAAIRRDHLASADPDIDLSSLDQVFFITRHPLMPPVARLSPTQAAAAFMCGESIETSAGDPDRAGEPVRVVGTNPFIIGSKGEEGNRFRALIDRLDIDAYVLNTGSIGDVDIRVDETVTLLREIARGRVSWLEDTASGYTIPGEVPGLDMDRFRPNRLFDAYDEKLEVLQDERRQYLRQFTSLDDSITDGF